MDADYNLGGGAMDAGRVAEVIVRRADGTTWYGSGYRVTTDVVLTAAHVLDQADRVEVRFDGEREGQWQVVARPRWTEPEADVALLTFDPPSNIGAVPAATLGCVPERWALVSVHVVGFPRWKRRVRADGSVFREMHDAVGTVAILSNRKTRTLEITTTPPADDPTATASPWEAMSGAAVWAGGCIVGVVTRQYGGEGLGRLTAVRMDALLTAAGTLPAELASLLQLPRDAGLVSIPMFSSGWLTQCGYVEKVRDIAPADGLRDRDVELDQLVAFCAGDEPYLWWQAGPWAGKTALMATFALDPPAGTDVVSFFITARLASQADSGAFTDALLEQLAALVGQSLPLALTPGARDAHRRALLKEALSRARQTGRRLVIVVDGLDEDRGSVAGSGLDSIASLLPKVPDDNLRVIVAGRPNPPVPDDVPLDHPLRSCRIRLLEVSPHATQTAYLARRELDELLTGDESHREVIGMITASGGGLGLTELQELTGRARYELDQMIGGVFGRTIANRSGADNPHRIFLFTHETLRVEAIGRLGEPVLRGYRERILAWADGYQRREWPVDTPPYLLRGYPQMLQEQGDVARLVHLALSTPRHDRMLDVTGGDAAALSEIKAAQDLVLRERDPDVPVMARLATQRDELADRNIAIPVRLPAAWAAVGHLERAEALARSIANPDWQAEALVELVPMAAKTGEYERAEVVARNVLDPYRRAIALARLARALPHDPTRARSAMDAADALDKQILDQGKRLRAVEELAHVAVAVGESARAKSYAKRLLNRQPLTPLIKEAAAAGHAWAESLSRRIVDHVDQGRAMIEVAAALMARDPERAETLARGIHNTAHRAEALARLVNATLREGDLDRAARIAATIREPRWHLYAIAALAESAAEDGRERDASEWLKKAESTGRHSGYWYTPEAWIVMVRATARLGRFPQAEQLAGEAAEGLTALAATMASIESPERAELIVAGIGDPHQRTRALTELLHVAAVKGDHVRVNALAGTAKTVALRITDPDRQSFALTLIAQALASHGFYAEAEAVADSVPGGDRRADALIDLALRAAGQDRDRARALTARAEEVARQAGLSDRRATTGGELAEALAVAGFHDRAEAVAREIADLELQTQVYSNLAMEAAAAGSETRANQLADNAESAARGVLSPAGQVKGLTYLASALIHTGDHERSALLVAFARTAVARVPIGRHQAAALIALSRIAMEAGRYELAESVARDIVDPHQHSAALTDVATSAAAAGRVDQAERISQELIDVDQQTQAVTALSRAVAARGNQDRAAELAHVAEALAPYIADPGRRIVALVELAAVAGDHARAAELGVTAVPVAHAITDPDREAKTLIAISRVLIGIGRPEVAIALQREISDPLRRDEALIQLYGELGDHTEAARLAVDMAPAARVISDRMRQARVLTQLSRTMLKANNPDRAAEIAADIAQPQLRARMFSELIRAALSRNDRTRASTLARLAEAAAASIPEPGQQAESLAELAQAADGAAARRFIALAFSTGRWTASLRALARVQPDTLLLLANEQMSRVPGTAL